jgi:formylglycine-generating enzyme required for sulfatase activity
MKVHRAEYRFRIRELPRTLALIASALLCSNCGGSPFAAGDSDTLDGSVAFDASTDVDAAIATDGAAKVDAARDGDSAQALDTKSEAETAAPPIADATPPGDGSIDAAVIDLCGLLRTGDDPTYTRELCVPGGSFMMGSNAPNLGGSFADHTPAHPVTISAFVIDAYEVTVGRYRACVTGGGCYAPTTGASSTWTATVGASESLPVTFVRWDDALAFCAWDEGRKLPTEAQWEFAARGPMSSTWPWGDEFECARAALGGFSGGPCPQYAGSLPRAVGTTGMLPKEAPTDLIGNVAEWTADWVASYPNTPQTDPIGAPTGTVKVVRGGSWTSPVDQGKGFARSTHPCGSRGVWGFRCARQP